MRLPEVSFTHLDFKIMIQFPFLTPNAHLFVLSLSPLALTGSLTEASQFLFVSHKSSPEITTYKIDPESGKLSHFQSCQLESPGGFLRFSPSGNQAYVNRSQKGNKKQSKEYITTLNHSNGKLTALSSVPCDYSVSGMQVHPSGKALVCSHYKAGKVTAWEINSDKEVTGTRLSEIDTAERAHFVATSPNHDYIYIPHTRPNAIFQFSWQTNSGTLTPLEPLRAEGPDKDNKWHEPRHLAFHSKLALAYSSNERGGGISRWEFQPSTGQLSLQETHSTLPKHLEGDSAASDIVLTPDNRFAYVANRSRIKDTSTIASFQLSPQDGTITLLTHTAISDGSRALHIESAGNFLYAAGTSSDTLLAFRIDPQNGNLTLIESYQTKRAPFWLESQ